MSVINGPSSTRLQDIALLLKFEAGPQARAKAGWEVSEFGKGFLRTSDEQRTKLTGEDEI